MNKENCALKLVDEIIVYYDARSKKHQIEKVNVFLDVALCGFGGKVKSFRIMCCFHFRAEAGFSVFLRNGDI